MTEQGTKENKLPDDFFYNIYLHAGDGIFLINQQGVMVEMNPRGCEILGCSREELLGQPVLKFQPADEIENIQKKLALLAIEKLVTTESAFIRKDGSRVPVEITGKMLSNGFIVGMLRDVSYRKPSEQALLESEQKFRSLVEHSPDGILIVDEQGSIIEWNHGQEEITGLKRADALGRKIWDVQSQLTPAEYRSEETMEGLKKGTLAILRTGTGSMLNIALEARIQMPDGVIRTIEVMMYTYTTNHGFHVGSITRDITKRKQIEMLLEYLAMHDALTDLPNRQLFENRLLHAIERTRRDQNKILAVMMLDLDNFKELNDSRGHAYGDQALKIIGQRLQTCLRKSDTAARMGGDEFALINEAIADVEGIRSIANKVLRTISAPMEIEGSMFTLTVSIGISVFSPATNTVTTLLRQADIALYKAKESRNCYQFYNVP